jgi:hypothetical protein
MEITRIGLIQRLATEHGVILPTSDAFRVPDFVPEGFNGTIIQGMDELAYHTDHTAVSRGDVVAMLKSPAHMAARRQQGEFDRTDNDALRIGRLVHSILLEPEKFKNSFVVMPEFVGKTLDGRESTQSKEAKKMKADWLAQVPVGTQIIEKDELVMLFGMARGLSKNRRAMAIFEGAIFEASVFYRDPLTGLKARTRPDIINRGLGVLADLKSARSAEFEVFQRDAWSKRYDIQLSMYAESVYQVTGEMPSIYPLIVLEKDPPYSCVVYPLDVDLKARGAAAYRRGMDAIADCITRKEWVGFPEIQDLSAPRWALLNRE